MFEHFTIEPEKEISRKLDGRFISGVNLGLAVAGGALSFVLLSIPLNKDLKFINHIGGVLGISFAIIGASSLLSRSLNTVESDEEMETYPLPPEPVPIEAKVKEKSEPLPSSLEFKNESVNEFLNQFVLVEDEPEEVKPLDEPEVNAYGSKDDCPYY